MKKTKSNHQPIKKRSWVHGVRADLDRSSPSGWTVPGSIKGRGVQLLPSDEIYLNRNRSGRDVDLVGEHKIIFEFFRLDQGGKVKISARVSAIEGQPLFHEFLGIAVALGCPRPKSATQKTTQSVAAWPGEPDRQKFDAADHSGMANWIRRFLSDPPADFTFFVAAARNILSHQG